MHSLANTPPEVDASEFLADQAGRLFDDLLKDMGYYMAPSAPTQPVKICKASARPTRSSQSIAHWTLAMTMLSELNRWRKAQKRAKRQSASIQAWTPPHRQQPSAKPKEKKARPKAIIFGLHWLDYGGAEKFAIDCIQVAKQHAFCIVLTDVASSHPLKSKIQSEQVRFVHAEQLKANIPDPKKNIHLELLEALFTSFDVCLVHIHHCMWLYNNLDLIKQLSPQSKIMDTLHIIEHDKGGYPAISCARSKYIDIHHAISQQLADYLQSKASRVDGVHVAKLLEPQVKCKETPNFTSGKPHEIRIVFVGRLDYQKRPRLFVAIAQKIAIEAHRIGLKATFTMIGDGRLKAETTKTIHGLGMQEIRVMAPNAPVSEVLSESDFLILPSENEGIPLVAYEAIAHGCIPICTDVGGNREICGPWVINANPILTVSDSSKLVLKLATSSEDLKSAWKTMRENYLSQSHKVNGIHFCEGIYKNAIQA
jgi:L-malate glycosyltransferase